MFKFKKLTSTYNGYSEKAEVNNGDIIIDDKHIIFICNNCGDYFTVNIERLKEALNKL